MPSPSVVYRPIDEFCNTPFADSCDFVFASFERHAFTGARLAELTAIAPVVYGRRTFHLISDEPQPAPDQGFGRHSVSAADRALRMGLTEVCR